ncbi:ATP-binding protein [Caldicellulosiruptoraceae bacterium PP1]
MLRKIIKIDEEKCNGCGLCANACHEGAIQIIDGKAKLISEEYCDGLGNCLPVCPTGAISIVEEDVKPFNQELVEQRMQSHHNTHGFSCPGSRQISITREQRSEVPKVEKQVEKNIELESQLQNWPVQLNLINPYASYLDNADLLIAADCTAFAYANIHNEFMKDKVTLIGCPKLDNVEYYREKLIEILSNHDIKSITVLKMEVPCCGGIAKIVKDAMLTAQIIVPYNEVTITINGDIKK